MQLASIFQDHAVLQRNVPLPIWGWGTPGEIVVVQWAGHESRTEVDECGHWMLRFPPLQAGGPHQLKVEAPSGRAELDDLLIGDVWICSGQSNMEWKLKQSGEKWMQDAPDLPQVRMLTVDTPAKLGRTVSVNGEWTLCNPASLAEFSAVAGFFGREIHGTIKVPIGLICNAWGGTRVQAWISREALMTHPAGRDEIGFYESLLWQNRPPLVAKTYEEWERTDAPQDPGNLGLPQGWTDASFDDSEWPTMLLPGHWTKNGHPHSGIFWFRRTEIVPESWVGNELELSLGAIDKNDDTWVNGELVGSMGTPDAWCKPRVYSVPGHLIGPDRRVVISVRARSHIYDGGMTGPAQLMKLQRVGEPTGALPLVGNWHYKIEHNWGQIVVPEAEWGGGNANSPHIMFDSRLTPLIPYGLKGVLWYQGESNAGEASLYRQLLPLMIQDWRRVWSQGNFTFLQVQLANFGNPPSLPVASQWAELREAQLGVLEKPATGMAVAIDIGEANDIHPANKRDVGLRLARWALAETYDLGGLSSGPIFTGMKIEADGSVRCSFRNTGSGLEARGGALQHFALAGKGRFFQWAEAVIDGDTVVVRTPGIPNPVAVRYAWSDNPEGCNLYNKEGLPASPFRSDSWPA